MKYLLDTNIISELRKKTPNLNVINFIHALDNESLYISCITIGELTMGALKKNKTDKAAGKALLKWIKDLKENYSENILQIDVDITEIWAKLLVIDSTNAIDSLIATQSLANDLTLVTRNIKHFQMFNINLINPFEA